MKTLSGEHTERQAAAAVTDLYWVYGDAWECVWDRFWSITMYFNGMVSLLLPLPLPLDARCVYALTVLLHSIVSRDFDLSYRLV